MRPNVLRYLLLMAAALCGTSAMAATPPPHKLIWRGDLATSRSLMHDLAKAWHKAGHPAMTLQPFSTISGIDAAVDGKADFAGSARAAFAKRKKEDGLNFTPVAWDALVMIVHRHNPVRNVSLNQLHDIYYGKITNWKALGGPDQPINLYSVASPLDGIEFSLRKYLFRRGNQPVASPRLYINTSQLEAAVAIDPMGLGVSTLSGVHDNKKLRMLRVENVAPSLATVDDGSYPLYQPLYLVTPANSPYQQRLDQFLGFATSDAGRKIMRANHVLPYDATAPLASDLDRHLVTVQDMSAPQMNGPVAAPGATYASRTARAPTSERTLKARQDLADQRKRSAASKKAIEANSKSQDSP
ncbi:MAG: substrate-binding domain-containing protein [Rhodanobacteraceae bacterium]